MNDSKYVNEIRAFCADMVQRANSGHPGAPMGMAPMAHVLWSKHLTFCSDNPNWINRDRVILSNGHACALLYCMLHLSGYKNFNLNEIKNFRQLGSNTPGHPEAHIEGIEVTTGPLGQGFANGVGLAMAQKHLASLYNLEEFKIFDHYVYVFCGDGCLMEGITSEASSLAGHYGLGNLIVMYDDNQISIDGSTELTFTENVADRYKSYGWHVVEVLDGDNDLLSIDNAIIEAKNVKDKPSLIKVKTTIGYGSIKENTSKAHGSPLGEDDIKNLKVKFGLDPNKSFALSDEIINKYKNIQQNGKNLYVNSKNLFEKYCAEFPNKGNEIKRRFSGKLPIGWDSELYKFKQSEPESTRKLFGQCLNIVSDKVCELVGGSADLTPSTFTYLNNSTDMQKDNFQGKNIRFGVREHAMGAIINGLSAYGGFIPYGATFLNFIGYMLGSVTLSALSGRKVLYVMTHDSICLGEDGPTHQPIEKLMLIRSTPNILLFRPADANEVVGSMIGALQENIPSVMSLSRHKLPQLEGTSSKYVLHGAYVIYQRDNGPLDLILLATGSEVHLCLDVAKSIPDFNIRVVSMPCWELFEKQSDEYKINVLRVDVPIVSVEAGTTLGWERYANRTIGIDSFGLSGTYEQVMDKFGFTVSHIKEVVEDILD